MRYRAFISYSHKDARWANWLHRTLEAYRVPARLRGSEGEFGPLPDRLLPIFRDREELASAGKLGPKIETALLDSEALVVICSPASARSTWVNEEILRFKRTGRANRIYCLIVAGEPNAGDERECFAPALRHELDADGRMAVETAEPVAADVRAGTDGKALARLKLLAGLLGVDLDTLRRRESARRQRRLLAALAMAMLVALTTTFLAIQAVIARNAAERRQKQAETLIGFMIGDLNEKLAKVSRLDVLESVNQQVMAFFETLPSTDVTDLSLEQRAQVLVKIGNVRLTQGQLPEALQSYLAANALTAKLGAAAPTDIQRQLAHAETLTYLGTIHWYRGDLDRAQRGFEAAQRVLLRTEPLAPDDPDLLYQLSTLDNNFGHVLEGRGRLDQAERQYRAMLALAARLVRIEPANAKWQVHLGLAHNNLAKMALLRGDLATAVAEYRTDADIEATLASRDPGDNAQAERLVLARAALGRTTALTGQVDDGIAYLRQAVDGATQLLAVEPASADFQEDLGLYSTQLAYWLRVTGNPVAARPLSAQGHAVFERLTGQDPGHTGRQRGHAEARLEQASQARDDGDDDPARGYARQALATLDPLLAQQPEDRATVLATVATRLLLASVVTDADAAHSFREQSLRTIQAQSSGRDDPRLRALEIEALLALGRDANAGDALPKLWRTGFRDPRFIALMREHQLPVPAAAIPESAR